MHKCISYMPRLQKNILRRLSRTCIVLLFFLSLGHLANAQDRTISGKVTDARTSSPIPGVTVRVKEVSNIGTITDEKGMYQLAVPAAAKTLVFSFVGYEKKEVPITSNNINVALAAGQTLDQLVVIGYGTEKERDITGSVATVSSEDIEGVPVADVGQALAGKLPGVNITSQDGRPGADISIRVRGGGSISQSNQPLFIVDGFPVGSISDIPVENIKSISVLKDASSTAIYGARGSHGVIVVTTKQPEIGKLKVTYNGYAKFNTPTKYLQTMNAYDYIAYNWAYAAAISDNYAEAWEDLWAIGRYAEKYKNSEGIDHYKNIPAANFVKQVYGHSFSQNHNLNLSYGNEKTQYRLSLSYLNDDGMKVNSYYNRAYANFNLNQKLASNFTFTLNTRFTATNKVDNESTRNGQGSILSSAYWFRPIATKDVLGELNPSINTQIGFYDNILQDVYNPVSRIKDYTPLQKNRSIRTNTSLSWQAIKGLTLKSALSVNARFNKTSTWSGAIYNNYLDADGNKTYSGNASITNYRGWGLIWTNTIHYNFPWLHTPHSLNLLLGQEVSNSGAQSTNIRGNKYPATYTADRAFANMDSYLQNSDIVNGGLSSEYGTPGRLLSFFGRANYALYDKYLFTVTFRADGSSRFAPSNRWGYFPAAAVAWRLSEEDFLKNVQSLSNLKLRFSYGTTGDDGIDAGLWEQNWASAGLIGYSIKEAQQSAYVPASSTLANPNLKWETTISRDLGVDFGFFNGRLHGTIDVYKNTTENLLMLTSISAISGFSSMYKNVGSTSNQGIEIAIGGGIVRSKDFNLNANFNIGINRCKIEELSEGVNGLYSTHWGSTMTQPNTGDYQLVEGEPVGIVRGYVYDGWYTVDDFTYKGGVYTLKPGIPDANAGILGTVYGTTSHKPAGQVAYPGVVRFKDLNGDDVIDENDVTTIGNMNPKHTGGFSVDGNYKNIDFALHLNWSYGNQIYNVSYLAAFYGSKEDGLFRNRLETLSHSYRIYDIQNGQLTPVTDPAALKTLNQGATTFLPYHENPIASSLGIMNGSYLRLNTVTIGYSLPLHLLDKISISRLRLYGTIYNAFVLTNYPGLDPEVNTNTHQGGTAYPTPGMDWGAYPRARSFVLGINVEF